MLPEKLLDVNPKLCTGCNECELACSITKTGIASPHRAGIRVVKDEVNGVFYPVVCSHCDPAYCILACPVGAMQRDINTGAVFINQDTCIRCRLCMVACPIGAIQLSPEGQLVKCDLCRGRQEGPRCVEFCRVRPENSSWWMANPRMSCLRYVNKESVASVARLVALNKARAFLSASD